MSIKPEKQTQMNAGNNKLVDTIAPIFVSAAINGDMLVMTYAEATTLDALHTAVTKAFAVKVGGVANAVKSVTVDAVANTVALTLSTPVTNTDVVTVAYKDRPAKNNIHTIQDAAGNDAPTFSAQTVTNNTPDTIAPIFVSAAINGDMLVMTYAEATTLDALHTAVTKAFAVKVGGVANAVKSVTVDAVANTVTLTLSTPVTNTDVVTVAYKDRPAKNNIHTIQDAAGNDALTFSAQAVTNNTPEPTPTFTSNEAPSAIALSASTVAENAAGVIIGSLSVADPDIGNSHSFIVDDARFEVVSSQLKLKDGISLDYETATAVNVTVTATDTGGLSKTQAFVISVTDVNEAPGAIALSASTVAENAAGVIIGSLSVADPDIGNSHNFTVDDARFEVVSSQLKLKDGITLDYETATAVNVTVTVTDTGGLSKTQAFVISVTDVNEAPGAIALSANTVAENAAGVIIGSLSVADPDIGNSHSFTVDDARFEVASSQLKLKDGITLDYETATAVNVTVTATDTGGLSKTQAFVISVTDVNEAPSAIALSASTVAENAVGVIIGSLSVADPDIGNSHSFTVDDARFEVVSSQLKLKNGISLDYETATAVNVTVTATDTGGLSKTQAFVISVTDINETPIAVNSAPSAVVLSANTVAENAAGVIIGSLSVTDPDTGDTHSFAIDDTRFEVVSGQLKLKDGVSLNHETAATVSVTVTATDAGGLSKAQAFNIDITDIAETTPITGTVGPDIITFPAGLDDFIITGLAGNDTINTGVGNDIVRPGEGADTVNTGTGNDIVIVVGQTAAGQYAQSDITNPGGSGIDLSSVLSLTDLNGRTVSEAVTGESIDGGTGVNRLVIYGNVDLTGVTLTNITQFQVNSTVTISAQQLTALNLSVIFGDGESVLNLTNSGIDPVTLDLSGMAFADFRTLNVGAGVTVVLDQADVDSLQNLSGEGVLKASVTTGALNLTGKYISLAVQNKDGTTDDTHGGGTYVAGKLLIGAESADTLTGGATADRIEGGAGNDSLVGGDGNDVLRGGIGVDSMDGGVGDDSFVVVGDISGGGKVDSAADTAALGFPLTNLNGKNLNEDEDGATEIIIGGDGNDTLYVYGTADLSHYDISGIEHIEIRSDVKFLTSQLQQVTDISGDGSSIIRLERIGIDPVEIDLSTLVLANIGQIEVGTGVTLKIASLDQLGGARILTGDGLIQSTNETLTLPNTYSVENSLTFGNTDTSQAEKLDKVVSTQNGIIADTSGNNYMTGTDYADIFESTQGGDDVLTGKKGSDTYKIAGTGKKIIIDVAEKDNGLDKDTLDFSGATGAAVINLTDGGTVGSATVQLGSGSATGGTQQDAPKVNLMLIFDVSGSMSGFRLQQAKQAANDLLAAYDNLGDIAVRIVTFQNSATSSFNGINAWMDVSTAKGVINSLNAGGGTNYDAAINTATQAFDTGKETTYFDKGTDVSYFLSDGEPNNSIYYKEVDWENFLIQNQITSHAIGFGGLNSTYQLEPIAYDGTKVNLATDDHTPGEIAATITVDTSKLGETLVSQAKLDFIEDTVGTSFDDALIGNGLDNKITGGQGNDYIDGNSGSDQVIYRGRYGDYTITPTSNGLTIVDSVQNRDGADVIHNIEKIIFSDRVVLVANNGLVELANAEDIFREYDTTSSSNLNYFKFFFDLSNASYFHESIHESLAAGDVDDTNDLSIDATSNIEALSENKRTIEASFRKIHEAGSGYQNINILDGIQSDASQSGKYVDSKGSVFMYDYQFKDGWYVASDNPASVTGLIRNASVAMFGKSESGKDLFVTFRGTDSIGAIGANDWLDDFSDMTGHYNRMRPFVDAVNSYIENHPEVEHVYVSGHSLGGEMATWYMEEPNHKNDSLFQAVLFEPANKPRDVLAPYQGDTRIVSFEAENDLVPDLGVGFNPGKAIHLNIGGSDPLPLGTHGLIGEVGATIPGMQQAFLSSIGYIDRNNIPLSSRIYSIYGNNVATDGGITDTLMGLGTGLVATSLTALYSSGDVTKNSLTAIGVSLGAFGYFVENVVAKCLGKMLSDYNGAIYAFSHGNGFKYLTNLLTTDEYRALFEDAVTKAGEEMPKNLLGEQVQTLIAALGSIYEPWKEAIETGYNFTIGESSSSNTAKLQINQIPGFVNDNKLTYSHTQGDINYVEIEPFFLTGAITGTVHPIDQIINFVDPVIGNQAIKLVDQDINIDASSWSGSSPLTLHGNFGDNYLIGSTKDDALDGEWGYDRLEGLDGNDILVGNGDNDILFGGIGNDFLISNTVTTGLINKATNKDIAELFVGDKIIFDDLKQTSLQEEISNHLGVDVSKAQFLTNFDSKGSSVLYGGDGNDQLVGNYATDYYFIDVSLQDNTNNVDQLWDFDIGGTTLYGSTFFKDYIVFPRDQLGLSFSSSSDMKVFGQEGFSQLNGDNFEAVSSMTDYTKSYLDSFSLFHLSRKDSSPFFCLDKSSGDLYFDQDGYQDVGDQVKVATISSYNDSIAGTDLDNFGGDQILLVNEFKNITDYYFA